MPTSAPNPIVALGQMAYGPAMSQLQHPESSAVINSNFDFHMVQRFIFFDNATFCIGKIISFGVDNLTLDIHQPITTGVTLKINLALMNALTGNCYGNSSCQYLPSSSQVRLKRYSRSRLSRHNRILSIYSDHRNTRNRVSWNRNSCPGTGIVRVSLMISPAMVAASSSGSSN